MIRSRVVILGRPSGIVGHLAKLMAPDATLVVMGHPKNHVAGFDRTFGTVYLWEDVPHLVTKPIKILTCVDGTEATEESVRRYKTKIGKAQDMYHWRWQFPHESTGHDIVNVPEVHPPLVYGDHIDIDIRHHRIYLDWGHSKGVLLFYDWLISTIPLPEFIKLAGLEYRWSMSTVCKSEPIYVWTTPQVVPAKGYDIEVNYSSDPSDPVYRTTSRGGRMHQESMRGDWTTQPPDKVINPGKIWRTPDVERIISTLLSDNVACFGRYGAWSPDELLHDTYARMTTFMRGN